MHYIIRYKQLKINIITIIILSIISQHVSAQIFGEEQNPLSVKWRQIKADGFSIIFPRELEKEANRMATTLSTIYPRVGYSLGQQKTTLPLLLQNRGVVANGFVRLAPKKSEFYSTPPQGFDSQDWLNNLAVHELRHVAQFDKLTGGRAFPFPEEIYFAWFGLSIPTWFFEGDAVITETALTQSGRGRQPEWIMPYRTSLLEGKKLSYSKAYFGSDKDVTPGYYQLGYLMTANMRKAEGPVLFDSILSDIRRRPLRLYPFSNSLRKFTGKGTRKWFLQTTDTLRKYWQAQAAQSHGIDYPAVNPQISVATNYYLPVRLPDGRILALKESKKETNHFVIIDHSKKEQRLFGIAYQEQPWFSYAAGRITWDEVRYDPRYKQRSYSVLCTYDLLSRKYRKLSSRSRLFSPSLSADGSKIVAVQIDLSNQSSLVELDATNGKILNVLPNPRNLILQTPSYDSSGQLITYIAVSEKGKSLEVISITGKQRQMIAETRQQLGRPIYFNRCIVFNAHYNGINNIYKLDTASKKISALSASKYGAFNATPESPSANDGHATEKLMFSDYALHGFSIAELAPGRTRETPQDTIGQQPSLANPDNHFVNFATVAITQEVKTPDQNIFDSIPAKNFPSKPYPALSNLLNFHSISPFIENEYRGGFELKSNNLLSTFDFFTGAGYQRDIRRFDYYTGFSFKAFYPIIRATYRNRPLRTFYNSKTGMQQGDWRENTVQLQASLPLSINALAHSYSFSFNTITSYTSRYQYENLPANFIGTIRFPMEYNFAFTHSLRQAGRDIAPRWGQVFRLTFIHQPFDDKLKGRVFATENFLYFPGILHNHSFLANFNYQTASGIRRYEQQINTVYGYNNIKARSTLNNTLLFNYRFPFAFPDAEIGPLAYVKNLRAGVFFHYENIGTETNLAQPKTYGFELRSSMHLLRYQPLADIGARFVFVNRIYHQNPILEFIFNYRF